MLGAREKDFELHAETEADRAAWVSALKHVSDVANQRVLYFKDNNINISHGENFTGRAIIDENNSSDLTLNPADLIDSNRIKERKKTGGLLIGKKKNKSAGLVKVLEKDTDLNARDERRVAGAFAMEPLDAQDAPSSTIVGAPIGYKHSKRDNSNLTVAFRLDVDLEAMPPGSVRRREFVRHFQEDISRVCGSEMQTPQTKPHEIHITGLRRAPNLDWMTIVEFTFQFDPNGRQKLNLEAQFLDVLQSAHENQLSILYQGHVTCNVDPSFSVGLESCDGDVSGFSTPVGAGAGNPLSYLMSPVKNIQSIFNRYKNVPVTKNPMYVSCFSIGLLWRESMNIKQLWILNPRLVGDRSACLIYPYDVKRSLGINGTVHDGYLEPKRLVPKGLVPGMSAPIPFLPSERSQGLPCIDATLLKSGLTYQVDFNDTRKDALNHLSQQEKSDIANSFQKFDINGDGAISRAEAIGYAQQRTMKGRAAIESQFQQYIASKELISDDVQKANLAKEAQVQALEEAELQLMTMLENADIDGNGSLTYDEFALAEAWWLRSTLNPEKVLLF